MKLHQNMDSIIQWIEENKHFPLRIDDIALRAGYSKWYLQRAFYSVTGINIATYCRRRRLTLAVLAVKYSSMSLAEIASWFQYDSQQTFNKEFSRYFGTTPGRLRKMDSLDARFIFPALSDKAFHLDDDVRLCRAPVTTVLGVETSYLLQPNELDRHPVEQRKKVWDQFLLALPDKPEKIYCLTGPQQAATTSFDIHYRYCPAVDVSHRTIISSETPLKEVSIDLSMLYASFTYAGHFSGVEGFIRNIYNYEIPRAGLSRADGDDIEEFTINGREAFGDSKGYVQMTYYVPVIPLMNQ